MRKPKQEKHAYDAQVALWLSRDPIGEAGGLNLYGYVENDPVNWLDQFGLCRHQTQQAIDDIQRTIGELNRLIGEGTNIGDFMSWQNNNTTTLGLAGVGSFDFATQLYGNEVAGVINDIETNSALTTYRIGGAFISAAVAGVGNMATLRPFWNNAGTQSDLALPFITSERFGHEALLKKLRDLNEKQKDEKCECL